MMVKQSEPEKQPPGWRELEEMALELLRQALGTTVEVRAPARDTGADAAMRLPGGSTVAIQLKNWNARQEPERGAADHTIYVLRRATKRMRDELRREGVSFVDLSGAVYLALPTILVDRADLRPPRRRGIVRQSFDPFSDRGSLIVRTLMEATDRDERTWGVRELAADAGVSPATATRVARELERLAAVQIKRSGRAAAVRLTDAKALFDCWTRAYDWTRNQSVSFAAPMGDADRFVSRMTREWVGPRWALGLQAGAARVAPHATWERVHVYVDVQDASTLVSLGEAHGWEPSDDGRLLLMRPYYRTSVWHGMQHVREAPVVSTLQLALDLWHYPLRGREQAEHLLSVSGLAG